MNVLTDNHPEDSHTMAPRQGFASMSLDRRGELASQGGKAAHAKGKAHQFTTEEAAAAGRKGGVKVSLDREHMAEIGRRGGEALRRARGKTPPPVNRLEAIVTTFNGSHPVGAPVVYRHDDGRQFRTTTRSVAWVLGEHTPVVLVNGITGGVALSRVSDVGSVPA